MRNEGNLLLAADSIRWLIGEESVIGAATSEEDEEIHQTRNQDLLWFWATVVLIPLAVLVSGVVLVLARRRRRSS
jgi:phosphoribosyl-ATP pyrophosphohydrolase